MRKGFGTNPRKRVMYFQKLEIKIKNRLTKLAAKKNIQFPSKYSPKLVPSYASAPLVSLSHDLVFLSDNLWSSLVQFKFFPSRFDSLWIFVVFIWFKCLHGFRCCNFFDLFVWFLQSLIFGIFLCHDLMVSGVFQS